MAAADLRLEHRFTRHLFGAAQAQATLDWQTRMLDARAALLLGGKW
jgi:hypothetical protein